jgi:hypothetical protein
MHLSNGCGVESGDSDDASLMAHAWRNHEACLPLGVCANGGPAGMHTILAPPVEVRAEAELGPSNAVLVRYFD